MGLSGLSGIGENPTDPAIERALHYIYEHVDQFYNFKGLHEFKAKFDPVLVSALPDLSQRSQPASGNDCHAAGRFGDGSPGGYSETCPETRYGH